MPAPEFTQGRTYIWIVSSFLFACIVAGGACLGAYLSLPEDQVQSWLPVLGVTLVCLPWAFWTLTFIYRIISRAFGFRVRVGDIGAGGAANNGGGNARTYPANEDDEQEKSNGHGDDVEAGASSSAAARDELNRASSTTSNESEMPLAKSMNSGG